MQPGDVASLPKSTPACAQHCTFAQFPTVLGDAVNNRTQTHKSWIEKDPKSDKGEESQQDRLKKIKKKKKEMWTCRKKVE